MLVHLAKAFAPVRNGLCVQQMRRSSNPVRHLFKTLQTGLGKSTRVIVDHADKAPLEKPYNRAPLGQATGVVSMTDTKALSKLICVSKNHGLDIVNQGGNTGLVYGSTPSGSCASVILRPQFKGIDIDTNLSQIKAGAGETVDAVQQYALDHGYAFNLKFGAQGTATIGGVIATNAGGMATRVQHLLCSVKGVDGTGTFRDYVVANGHDLRPDSVLPSEQVPWLGSQGYFGGITEGVFQLEAQPKERYTALLGFNTLQGTQKALTVLEQGCGDSLRVAEVMYQPALSSVWEMSSVNNPFTEMYRYYILVEAASTTEGTQVRDGFESSLMEALGDEEADCILAGSESQSDELVQQREEISDAVRQLSRTQDLMIVPHDLSLPRSSWLTLLERGTEIVETVWDGQVAAFGHYRQHQDRVAIHYNVLTPNRFYDQRPLSTDLSPESLHLLHAYEETGETLGDLEDFMVWLTARYGGNHSAEHGGLGTKTMPYTLRHQPLEELRSFILGKKAFDPNNLFQVQRFQAFSEGYRRRVLLDYEKGLIDETQRETYLAVL